MLTAIISLRHKRRGERMEKEIQKEANDSYSILFDKEMIQKIELATINKEAADELAHTYIKYGIKFEGQEKRLNGNKFWSIPLGVVLNYEYRVFFKTDYKGEVFEAYYQCRNGVSDWVGATNQDFELLINFASSCQQTYET